MKIVGSISLLIALTIAGAGLSDAYSSRNVVIADLDGTLLASISTGKRCGPVDYHSPDGKVSIIIAADKCVNLSVR